METNDFLHAATGKKLSGLPLLRDDETFRGQLLERFAAIHQAVTCEHAPGEALVLADAILRLDLPGPLVECGCYRGGMTAKLGLRCHGAPVVRAG